MRLALIACEVFHREFCAAAAQSIHQIDVRFLPKGLHDMGCEKMKARLQEEIDLMSGGGHEAILLGYGLCNNGVAGLSCETAPMMIPRAHDCIHLLFGDTGRYLEYTSSNPGTYYRSTGWIERGTISDELLPQSIQHQSGLGRPREAYIEQYGEENGAYLYELLGDETRNYTQVTFIKTGMERDASFEAIAKEEAKEHGWNFDAVKGDLTWLRDFVDGPWDEARFVTVQPGQTIEADYQGQIIQIGNECRRENQRHPKDQPS